MVSRGDEGQIKPGSDRRRRRAARALQHAFSGDSSAAANIQPLLLRWRAALETTVNPVMHDEGTNASNPPQLHDGGGATPARPGPSAAVPAHRRFHHDVLVFAVMLAAAAAAIGVDLNLYSTLESRIHMCLPR
jgi:hypothetical protein